jgi:hypothetical protein
MQCRYEERVKKQRGKGKSGMEGSQRQGSEVARLLQQIRAEYEAAQLGFSGLACGTVKHEFITQKMENMGKLQEELQTLVGNNAIALVVAQLETGPHVTSSPVQ